MVDVRSFDWLKIDDIEEFIAASDFKHVLYDTIIGLLQFCNNILNIILVHNIPCPVQFQTLNKLHPLLHINLPNLTKNLQSLLVNNHSFQKDIQPSIVDLNTNFKRLLIFMLISY